MCFFFVIFWTVLYRAGLLGFAATLGVSSIIGELPLTPHPAGWMAGTVTLALIGLALPALYGFWISQAGRSFFRDEILEPAAPR
jgi:hypothetical protein